MKLNCTRKAKQILSVGAALAVFFLPGIAHARDQIRIVGSSTVYPFVTAAAEEFGKTTKFKSPLVESTGTGGGFKLFCGGTGKATPDMANASRAIKNSERKLCADNGVKDITELKIGFDGIVIVQSAKAGSFSLTKDQLFRALAKKLPGQDGKLADNPHKKWSDVSPSLPASRIEVYGPPTTSGTRDAFVEMVMEKPCMALAEFKTAFADEDARKKNCHMMREDGHFIEAGENDNLIIQKVVSNPEALGIFGYSFLEQSQSSVKAIPIDAVTPSFESIAHGSYGISRPLFVYVKNAHAGVVGGLKEFAQELVGNKAAGEDGYLSEKGLIPLPAAELATIQQAAASLGSSK